ncbi:MAG: metal-dependent hydrolase [Acidobacteria bacterium]|nr:metal-dependent hydrolase [Acidobacteriota bacterium]
MDNITHSLFALTLGRTRLGQAGRGSTAALLIASNIPDIDAVALLRGGASYVEWHRGPTHGALSVVALGLPAAGLAWLWTRGQARYARRPLEPAATLPALAAVSMIGVLFHLLMDFPTAYGTRLLSPFDWHWYSVDWMPIIDIYLLAALLFGLVLAGRHPETRRRGAMAALIFMTGNYVVRAAAHHEALALAPNLLGALPERCDARQPAGMAPEHWPLAAAAPVEGREPPCLVEIAAIPTFLTPTTWRMITRLSSGYEVRDLDLLDALPGSAPARRVRLFFPNEWTPPVRMAAETPLGQLFLGFSRFPAARASVDDSGAATVRMSDMRFVGGPLRLERRPEREPFSALIRFDAAGRVVEQRFDP